MTKVWFYNFKSGDIDLSGKSRSGRQVAVNDERLLKLTEENSDRETRKLAEERRRQWLGHGPSRITMPRPELHTQKTVPSDGGSAKESFTGSSFQQTTVSAKVYLLQLDQIAVAIRGEQGTRSSFSTTTLAQTLGRRPEKTAACYRMY